MTNGSTSPRPDAEWFVDFDRLGPNVTVRFSFLGKIAACVTAGGLSLWASPVEGSGGGTLLATALLPLAGTAGLLVGALGKATVPNPGGRRYVVMTSFAGADGGGAPVMLDYEQFILAEMDP